MTSRHPTRRRFGRSLPAATAGGAAVGGQWLLHVGWPASPFAPYSVANWVIRHAPGSIATTAIERLGHNALRSLAAVAILGSLTLAVVARRLAPLAMAAVAGLLTVVAALVDPVRPDGRGTAASVIVAFCAVLGVRTALDRVPAIPSPGAVGVTRRQVVAGAGVVVLGIVLGAQAIRRGARRLGHLALVRADRAARVPTDPAFATTPALSPAVTSPGDHYTVDINLEPPIVDETSWRLRISGAVDREVTLDLEELRAMPTIERLAALSCISNPVGGNLVGNARWTGVPLADLLGLAQPRATATTVEARGADGYSETIPLDAAVDPDALVAFAMDGVLLPRGHGFPARLRIPARYGVKNVKWLTDLVVLEQPKLGYWARRGWDHDAIVHTESRIDTPHHGDHTPRELTIAGVAWAGNRRIDHVEVSTDDGATWRDAQLEIEADPLSWRRWKLHALLDPGVHPLVVRATDGHGDVQTDQRTAPHPSGATGRHRIVITAG